MSVVNTRMTRQAIFTKFIGPSNTKNSRIKAWCEGGSVTIGADHSLGIEQRHAKACETLTTKLGRDWNYVQGGHPDGNGYVFVEVPE